MQYLVNHWQDIVSAITAVVFTARIVVKLTPTPRDDSALEKVVDGLKHLGLHIQSKEDKPTVPPVSK